MKSNMKKTLLLSVFAVQAFSSTSFATTNDLVAVIHENQTKSGALATAGSTYACVDVSNLAIVTSLGIDQSGLTVHDKFATAAASVALLPTKSDMPTILSTAITAASLPAKSDMPTILSTAITAASLPAKSDMPTILATGFTAAMTGSGALTTLALKTDIAAIETAAILPLRLTNDVDNMIDRTLGSSSMSSAIKFNGTLGTSLTSTDTSRAALISGAATIAGLVTSAGGKTTTYDMWTSAEKLSFLLRAVFGIKLATFASWFNGASGTGCFGSFSDIEDSGIVLTVVFDHVLGRNLSGTNSGSTTTATTFAGGSAVFGRINAAAGTSGLTKPDGTTLTVASGSPLTGPTAYFNAILGTTFTNDSYSSDTGKYDLARLRALLTDVVTK